MGPRFQDRFEAGRFLAKRLRHYANDPAVVILGLPRGGVPVAYEIARALNAPLDVFVVRKVGLPGYEELAMGAIASGGVRVWNEELVQRLAIPQDVLESAAEQEQQELERRGKTFCGEREAAQIEGGKGNLGEDGMATRGGKRARVGAFERQK